MATQLENKKVFISVRHDRLYLSSSLRNLLPQDLSCISISFAPDLSILFLQTNTRKGLSFFNDKKRVYLNPKIREKISKTGHRIILYNIENYKNFIIASFEIRKTLPIDNITIGGKNEPNTL